MWEVRLASLATFRWYSVALWQRARFWLTVAQRVRALNEQKQSMLNGSRSGYRIRLEELGLEAPTASQAGGARIEQKVLYLGEIDQDGYIRADHEGLSGLPLVAREVFLPREKFKIFLVAFNGAAGIEKRFGNRKREFLTELSTLLRLNELGLNVPAVLDYDLGKRTLTMSYVPGVVLREALVRKGARLLDKQLGKQSEYPASERSQVEQRRIDEALGVMDQVIDAAGIAAIHEQIRRIHDAGYALVDIKYGNIILEKSTGKPFLLDFESAICLKELYSRSVAAFLKQRDMDQFHRIFGLQ